MIDWLLALIMFLASTIGAGGATATEQADRVNPPDTTIPVAVLPVAPEGLSLCDEMSWYRQQVGLPERFDAIGYRESRCQNDARPTIPAASCCRGWWAIHKSNITAPGYRLGAFYCGIRTEADYYGLSVQQKWASACFAKVIFDVSGYTPWAL